MPADPFESFSVEELVSALESRGYYVTLEAEETFGPVGPPHCEGEDKCLLCRTLVAYTPHMERMIFDQLVFGVSMFKLKGGGVIVPIQYGDDEALA